MKVAILTANTQVYKEQEEDKGGKVIRKIVEEAGQHVIFAKALPVDKKVLSTVMQRMADGRHYLDNRRSRMRSGRCYTGSNNRDS